jgi:hypothetical protein
MPYSNMLTINALVKLLDEQGTLPKKAVLEHIQVLQAAFKIANLKVCCPTLRAGVE